MMESYPNVSFVTSQMEMFGLENSFFKHANYDPLDLYTNNMVITSAAFRKKAWEVTGGYKSGIGYEDWEFWINLNENGFFGMQITEPLFKYRTSHSSRYIDDKFEHWENLKLIRSLHPEYIGKVKKALRRNKHINTVVDPETTFINLSVHTAYEDIYNNKKKVLIAVPWLTFGGAETVIYNFGNEVKNDFDLTYVTGLKSENEWEYKFKEITSSIYHLPNLFDNDKTLYLEFISNYILTRDVKILHIIHTDFMFDMLPEIKSRHPNLKIIVSMFNSRVDHFRQSIDKSDYIDEFITDNKIVAKDYAKLLPNGRTVNVIPNGIENNKIFNPELYDRDKERKILGIDRDDLAIFFIGRLSEEKNPDVFIEVAERILKYKKIKNVKFFIIGDGVLRAQIEKLLDVVGNENIKFLGYHTDIPRYLSAADVFVLPSSIEGFPLSVLEAMAMKVAVVASDVGAVSQIIQSGNNGLVVAAASVNEITDAIVRLKKNDYLLYRIKSTARISVEEKYSSSVMGDGYRKVYRELLK